MSAMTPVESDGMVDVVKATLDSMIDRVVNLHSDNTPKLPVLPSPLSLSTADSTATAATADENQSMARILLEITPYNVIDQPAARYLETTAHVPTSEEIGEMLFLQGYDSDGLTAESYPKSDLIALEN